MIRKHSVQTVQIKLVRILILIKIVDSSSVPSSLGETVAGDIAMRQMCTGSKGKGKGNL